MIFQFIILSVLARMAGQQIPWDLNGFKKYLSLILLQTIGRYRLFILYGHISHATTGFDKFCTERRIIPLHMPPHSSYLL